MSNKEEFLIIKDKDSKEIRYLEYDKIRGYNLTSKKSMKFEDSIDVKRIIIIKPSFASKIAIKKLNSKFDKLINLMSVVCDVEDEEASGESYRLALDEAERLRLEIFGKYKKYIDEEQLELMLKKIDILKYELNLRLEQVLEKLERQLVEGRKRK